MHEILVEKPFESQTLPRLLTHEVRSVRVEFLLLLRLKLKHGLGTAAPFNFPGVLSSVKMVNRKDSVPFYVSGIFFALGRNRLFPLRLSLVPLFRGPRR